MVIPNEIPFTNRAMRREIEKYRKKYHLSFLEAYNKLYHTNYKEITESTETSLDNNKEEKQVEGLQN